MFTDDELIRKRNAESLEEHLVGIVAYGKETEAILDSLRPATKKVKRGTISLLILIQMKVK